MKNRLIGLYIVCACCLMAKADDLKLWYQQPAKVWTEALPLGNSRLGAMVYGGVVNEQIQLNEETVWGGGPHRNDSPKAFGVLPKVRELIFAGREKEAEKVMADNFFTGQHGMPFQTIGSLMLEFDGHADYSNYRRDLDLERAVASVRYKIGEVNYTRTIFTSLVDNALIIRIETDKPGAVNFTTRYSTPYKEYEIKKNGKSLLLSGHGSAHEGIPGAIRFETRTQIKAEKGKVNVTNDCIEVKGADAAVIYVTAATNFVNYKDVSANETRRATEFLAKAMKRPYAQALTAHEEAYQKLFGRVSLNIGPSSQEETSYRIKHFNERKDLGLVALMFQFGRYLLISSSQPGGQPAGLQGIWNHELLAPWDGKYTININTEMNYWPAGSTNLAECTLPLIDFIRTLVKPGEKTAQAYFGARGWTASISGNIFGFTTPLESEDMSWNFNPMAGPWLATHVWDYYDYTRDKQFLKETGYGLIKSSAQFAVDYLWKKPDGTYTAAPSTSPEHGPIDQGTTFVHAVIREILLNAIDASKVLGVDKKERRQWEEVLENLAPYQIGRYGQLMEWSKDIDDPKDEHRHVNHLFGLHPGHTLSPITTPEFAKASKVVLEHRGDGATGWSMGWKLNQWARLHDGNHAYKLYGNLLKNGTLDNLWDTHPPFQIDGNFGGTAGVTEMLMQSHMGFIHLLPALPDAWKDGEVKGLCAKGNFEVNIRWKNGELEEVVILSKNGGICEIKYKHSSIKLKTTKGKTYCLTNKNGELVLFDC